MTPTQQADRRAAVGAGCPVTVDGGVDSLSRPSADTMDPRWPYGGTCAMCYPLYIAVKMVASKCRDLTVGPPLSWQARAENNHGEPTRRL